MGIRRIVGRAVRLLGLWAWPLLMVLSGWWRASDCGGWSQLWSCDEAWWQMLGRDVLFIVAPFVALTLWSWGSNLERS
jgi:hypothetical protein